MSDITRQRPGQPDADAQRLLELLSDRATGDLAASDRDELDSLLRRVPPLTDSMGRPITPESVDSVVGSLMLAFGAQPAAIPADARERLLVRGREIAREAGALGGAASRTSPPPVQRRPGSGPFAFIGWLAAAAAITIAFVLNYRAQPPVLRPPLTSLRAALLDRPGTVTAEWLPQQPYDAQKVTGDVVWNNATQEGYMRFKNLAAMDPSKEQFQLWIFDKTRDDKFPVDGGVFDLDAATLDPATGEYVVRINSTLPIREPAAFAVTVEKPGGVVVSDRSRVVTLAPVK